MVPPEPLIFPPDGVLDSLPTGPAVYIIWPKGGDPYLGRSNILRRRMKRLFDKWRLRDQADRVEYWPVSSKLEQWLISYSLARRHFPETYSRVLKLPKPPYVKLALHNEFPRTYVTTRFSGAKAVFYGPFPTRAAADQFEAGTLELFQIRRCQEDLQPSPDHPGCIYGEMRMCLRPCQDAVSVSEYGAEAGRVQEYLSTRGGNLLESAAAARDRSSENLEFEEARRQHERYGRIEALIKLGGDLARDVTALHGVAVTPSIEPMHVSLWFLRGGSWLSPRPFSVAPGLAEPLDKRLRAVVEQLEIVKPSLPLRQDHLALLAKWYFSSWRDGEWLTVDDWKQMPYRKLVNAISRIASAKSKQMQLELA